MLNRVHPTSTTRDGFRAAKSALKDNNATPSGTTLPVVFLAKILSLPLLLYIIFFSLRLNGFQPVAESGIGEFMTALYFLAGAGICYFNFAKHALKADPDGKGTCTWWWVASLLQLQLAMDEIYMIHENLGKALDVSEYLIFLSYGGILGLLILTRRSHFLRPATLFFLVPFAALSCTAILVDETLQEGILEVFGKGLDYEQLCESTSAFFLAATFATVAMFELKEDSEPAG